MNLLKYFGLTTIKDKEDSIEEIKLNLLAYKLLITEKPEGIKSFKDYEREIGASSLGFNQELFDKWYDIYQRRQYAAYKIRKLSLDPILLNEFLLAFSSFDFESVKKHMEEVKWTWEDSKKVPTTERLKDCVITLIPETFEVGNLKNAISSGGFTVSLGYETEDVAYCEIKFSKKY